MPVLALLVAPQAQRLLDAFSRLTGARIGIYDQAWREVSVGAHRTACAYCSLLRGQLGRERACAAEDRRRRIAATDCDRMVAYRCHAGLDEAVMPLSEDGRLVGWIMIGQFRSTGTLPARVAAAPWARGRREELARAFDAVPAVPARGRRDILALFSALVAGIAGNRLVVPSRDAAVERALAAGAGPGGAITLAQAARLAGVGRSRMAERARRALGCGLRQAQIRARLARAGRLLANGSVGSVGEAARRAGFADPAYFSRLWSRHHGFPPGRTLVRRC